VTVGDVGTTGTARPPIGVLAGLMTALALPALDLLVVATAGPEIAGDLGDLGGLAWLFVSYQIGVVIAMPLFGRLGDLLGRPRVYRSAILLFLAASVACGLSVSLPMLVVARFVQGVGGGGISGLTHAMVADLVPVRDRGRYAWLSPSVWAVSSFLGPLVGGLFADHWNWRGVFLVNLPVGLVALRLIGGAFTAPPPQRADRGIDLPGSALLVVAVGSIALVASTGGETLAWTSPAIIALVVVGLGSAALFVRQERRCSHPVVTLRFFRIPTVRVVSASTFFIGASNFATVAFLPLHLQVVVGQSATRSGLALLPISVCITLSSTLSGRYIAATGRYRWFPAIGAGVFALGMFLITRIDADTGPVEVWLATGLAGLGLGLGTPTYLIAMQNVLPQADVGQASALAMFARMLGQVFGPAVGSSLLLWRFGTSLEEEVVPAPPGGLEARDLIADVDEILGQAEPLRSQVVSAFADGMHLAFWFAVLLALVAMVIALFLRHVPLRDRFDDGALVPPDLG
jgi:EmrB/QacA subfamily drug resistance transporter